MGLRAPLAPPQCTPQSSAFSLPERERAKIVQGTFQSAAPAKPNLSAPPVAPPKNLETFPPKPLIVADCNKLNPSYPTKDISSTFDVPKIDAAKINIIENIDKVNHNQNVESLLTHQPNISEQSDFLTSEKVFNESEAFAKLYEESGEELDFATAEPERPENDGKGAAENLTAICRDSPVETEFQIASAIFEGQDDASEDSLHLRNEDGEEVDAIPMDETKSYEDCASDSNQNSDGNHCEPAKPTDPLESMEAEQDDDTALMLQKLDSVGRTLKHDWEFIKKFTKKKLSKSFSEVDQRHCYDDPSLESPKHENKYLGGDEAVRFHEELMDRSSSSPCLTMKEEPVKVRRSTNEALIFHRNLEMLVEKKEEGGKETALVAIDSIDQSIMNERLDLIEKSLQALHEARSKDLENLTQARYEIHNELKSCSDSVVKNISDDLSVRSRLKEVVTESLQEVFETIDLEPLQHLQEFLDQARKKAEGLGTIMEEKNKPDLPTITVPACNKIIVAYEEQETRISKKNTNAAKTSLSKRVETSLEKNLKMMDKEDKFKTKENMAEIAKKLENNSPAKHSLTPPKKNNIMSDSMSKSTEDELNILEYKPITAKDEKHFSQSFDEPFPLDPPVKWTANVDMETDELSDTTEETLISKSVNMSKISEADEDIPDSDTINNLSKDNNNAVDLKTSEMPSFPPECKESGRLVTKKKNIKEDEKDCKKESQSKSKLKRQTTTCEQQPTEVVSRPSTQDVNDSCYDADSMISGKSRSQTSLSKNPQSLKNHKLNHTLVSRPSTVCDESLIMTSESKTDTSFPTKCTEKFSMSSQNSFSKTDKGRHGPDSMKKDHPHHRSNQNRFSGSTKSTNLSADEREWKTCGSSNDSYDRTTSEGRTNSTYLNSSLFGNRTMMLTDQFGRGTNSKGMSTPSSFPSSNIFQYETGTPYQENDSPSCDPLTLVSALGCQGLQKRSYLHYKFEKNHQQSIQNNRKQRVENRKRTELLQSPAVNFVQNFESSTSYSISNISDSCTFCDSLEDENIWLNYKITKYERALSDLRSFVTEAECMQKKNSRLQEQNRQLQISIQLIEEELKHVSSHTLHLEKEKLNLGKTLAAKVQNLRKTKEELKNAKINLWQLHREKATFEEDANAHIEYLEFSIISQRNYFKKLLIELKDELISLCSNYVEKGSKYSS